MSAETDLVWPTTAVTRALLADPLDVDQIALRDDFIGGGAASNSTGVIGELGWTQVNITSASTCTWLAAIADHPGIFRMTTGTLDNDGAALTLNYGPAFAIAARLPPVNALTGWRIRFIFRITSTTSISFRIGITDAPQGLKPTNGIFWQYDTDDGDANFSFTCRSTTETKTASAVPADTAWHVVDIFSDTAGTISGSIDGGATINIAATVPTVAMSPWVAIGTRAAAAARTCDVDFFGLTMTVAR